MKKEYYKNELIINEVLKIGSKGKDVKKVQEWLNLWRYIENGWDYIVTIDGDYGHQTQYVVKKFQKMKHLEIDGIVGDRTFKALCRPLKNAFTKIEGTNIRKLIIAYANQHLKNIPRELNNNNEGPWVRSYMDGNQGKPWSWCMGFVQTILDQAFSTVKRNFTEIMPKSYSCDVVGNYGLKTGVLLRNIEIRKSIARVKSGDLFLIAKTPYDWVHTGIIVNIDGDWFHTIEGNTNDQGFREGFEVCRRMRNFKKHNIDVFCLNV